MANANKPTSAAGYPTAPMGLSTAVDGITISVITKTWRIRIGCERRVRAWRERRLARSLRADPAEDNGRAVMSAHPRRVVSPPAAYVGGRPGGTTDRERQPGAGRKRAV